eukprot:1286694-Rhodomonas_salina.1
MLLSRGHSPISSTIHEHRHRETQRDTERHRETEDTLQLQGLFAANCESLAFYFRVYFRG